MGSDGFALTPKSALEWPRRSLHLYEEIVTYHPDICCFQEVDKFQDFSNLLGPLGLVGLFQNKPDSPCLYQKGNSGPDGCAIFWKKSLFRMKNYQRIVLKLDDGQDSNQVVLFVFLEGLNGSSLCGKEILIAATHLKAKPNWSEVRYQQGKYLEQELRRAAGDRPVILCGDFNAEPTEKVVNVMKSSPLSLCSAYTLMDKNKEEPPYTTWKIRRNKDSTNHEVCHTIDYIFFSNKRAKCLQLLAFPTGEEMGEVKLPSLAYPSDHLSLVADFTFHGSS